MPGLGKTSNIPVAVKEPGPGASRRAVVLTGAAIAFAAFTAYHNSFSGAFLFDDEPAITMNPTLRQLWPVGSVLAPPGGMTVSGRPLLNLSLAVNYALGGTDVRGYHVMNLAIHLLAGLTLFGVARRALGGPVLRDRFGRASLPLAGALALLWTVHPLQTESVTYIIQRAESLMGLFYLLTLYCFVRGAERPAGPSVRWQVLAVAACLAGMATKEAMVTCPVMVLLFDRTFVAGSFREAWRRRRPCYLGLAATWLLLEFLMLGTAGRSGAIGYGINISWWEYALTQFPALVRYLQLSLWPHPLVFEYGPFWARHTLTPEMLMVAALAAGTAMALWRRPAVGFLGAWFFVILSPTSSVVPGASQRIVEHRMYLPLAAVMAAVVFGIYLSACRSGRAEARRCLALGLALAAGLGWLTLRRNEDYRSAVAIWSDTVAKRPGNELAHHALGYALKREGRLAAARAERETVEHLKSETPMVFNAVGIPILKEATINANNGNTVNFPELTVLTRVNLSATGGGKLLFPAAKFYTAGAIAGDAITADGAGSRIDLSALTSLAGGSAGVVITASGGGEVDLAGAITGSITLDVQSGGTIAVNGGLRLDHPGILTGVAGGNLTVAGDLLGGTHNGAHFAPLNTVTFNGAGTVAAPQQLEAMSRDLGATSAGFVSNFAYGSLALGNNTWMKLVDLADNAPGTAPEAVYAVSIMVPAGCTLDLNHLHLYARTVQVAGTVVNGTISRIGGG